MQAVLNTAELLDCILQYLDPKTLLLAQRVNHQWQGAIQSDPWCQEKLFYNQRPTRRETEKLYLWIPRKNRLKTYVVSDPPRILKPGRFLLAPIILNPLLTEEILPLEFDWPSHLVASDYPPNMPDQGQRLEIQQGQRRGQSRPDRVSTNPATASAIGSNGVSPGTTQTYHLTTTNVRVWRRRVALKRTN